MWTTEKRDRSTGKGEVTNKEVCDIIVEVGVNETEVSSVTVSSTVVASDKFCVTGGNVEVGVDVAVGIVNPLVVDKLIAGLVCSGTFSVIVGNDVPNENVVASEVTTVYPGMQRGMIPLQNPSEVHVKKGIPTILKP